MARKTPITVTLDKITVHYTCGTVPTSADITVHDINSSDYPCDLCGSHGNMAIDIGKCPVCNKYHTIEVNEW